MTVPTLGVAGGVAAAAAAYLLLGGAAGPRWVGRLATVPPRLLGVLGAAAVVATAIVVLDGTQVVLTVVAIGVAAAAAREVARRRRVVAAERRADQVLAMCESVAADLRSGQPPMSALVSAADDWPELAPAATAAQLGANVPEVLRDLALRPGAAQLRVVAAAWQVAHRSGAGLAGSMAMAADRLRDERSTARVVATELAAAQATARLLAALPVGVLLLGSGLGGDPIGFLLGTAPGVVCLCAGLALEYAGLAWLARIADQVTGRR
jgi:tight adherence protein B